MQRWTDHIFAYGVPLEAATVECVDCGHRLEHAQRGPLPPCPRYRDSSHARAAWRRLAKDDGLGRDEQDAADSR